MAMTMASKGLEETNHSHKPLKLHEVLEGVASVMHIPMGSDGMIHVSGISEADGLSMTGVLDTVRELGKAMTIRSTEKTDDEGSLDILIKIEIYLASPLK